MSALLHRRLHPPCNEKVPNPDGYTALVGLLHLLHLSGGREPYRREGVGQGCRERAGTPLPNRAPSSRCYRCNNKSECWDFRSVEGCRNSVLCCTSGCYGGATGATARRERKRPYGRIRGGVP